MALLFTTSLSCIIISCATVLHEELYTSTAITEYDTHTTVELPDLKGTLNDVGMD
jgi:hypothetical protein